jgi:hypothetical protein
VKITLPLLLSQEILEALKIMGKNYASNLINEIHIGSILDGLRTKDRCLTYPSCGTLPSKPEGI